MAAATLTVAVTAGCSGAVAAPADVASFHDQQLAWGPCAEFATGGDPAPYTDPRFECTRLEVPLDYAAPEGRTAQIAVLRMRASGERVGSLVVNPGGPGSSGTSLVPQLAGTVPDAVAQRFDIVGFDPRGVGASTPTIDCIADTEWDAERADLDLDASPAGIDETEAENRTTAERCVERSGGVEVLANMGTRDVARDLDVLRAALGDEKLTYLGYSYGTRIGTAYAEAFPENVRALVLDGAVNPAQSSTERSIEQAAGFQQAFEAYAAACAQEADCPLGDDPAEASNRFQEIVRPLIEEPAPTGLGRTLSYNDAELGVNAALYSSQTWPYITEGLHLLVDGDGSLLLQLADLYLGRNEDGSYGNTIDAFGAISCMDEERITDRTRQAELLAERVEVAPANDDGLPVVPALDMCAFWPVPPTSTPHTPSVEGLPSTLTVSVTGDPATPYQAGVELARLLDGSLLTVEGDQHGVALQGDECVDDIVSAYLIDLRTPEGEARCTL